MTGLSRHSGALEYVTLAGAALLFLTVGAVALVSPQLVADVIEVIPASRAGWNELRGNYGGVHLVMGAFLVVALVHDRLRVSALWLVALLSLGYSLGRLVDVVVGGLPPSRVLGTWAFEFLGALLSLWLIRARKVVA